MYCFRLLAPLALLILVAAPVHATLQAEAAVRNGGGATNNVLCINGGWGSTTALASCSDVGNIGLGEARANYGSLQAYARIHSDSPPASNLNYQSYAIARFDDEISLGSSILTPGESTDVRIVMALSGSILREQPPFLVGGTASVPWTFRVVINGLELQPSNGPLSAVGTFNYDFNMPAGGTVLFGAELISDARCFGCNGAYDAIADFFSTATVSSVDVLGLTPDQYDFTSLEGASYANVVPEPTTAALMAMGLVGIAVVGRQRPN
jgi:hypothetical protein